jgi:tRNA(Ile)-lysidine synthase
MPLLEPFLRNLESLGLASGTTLIAVSGGPDSMAMLDLMQRSRERHGLALIVAHVDHGIAEESGEVSAMVRRTAEALGIPLMSTRLELGPDAGETAARRARMAALEAMRESVGAGTIMLGHHADDQAETVLMRLLRGSGPAGLAAMGARDGALARPLLPFRRSELARYLHVRGLQSWEDPANRDLRHLRSWLRTEVFPIVERRLPDVVERLGLAGDDARRARRAWEAVIDTLPGLDPSIDAAGVSVAAAPLAGYDSGLAGMLIRTLARRAGHVIGHQRAQRALQLVQGGQSGAWVPLGGHWRASLDFGRLRIGRAGVLEPVSEPQCELAPPSAGWGSWTFRLRREAAPQEADRAGRTAWFGDGLLAVRGARPGDRMRPLGGVGHRSLVRLLQEARIPRAARRGVPVVVVDGVPAWVPGVARAEVALPRPGEEAWRIDAAND